MDIAHVRRCLRRHTARRLETGEGRHAAVAMILREHDRRLQTLFIERMRRVEDPWSGQMALPGGIVETSDRDSRRAAERETLEEVGIDLSAAEYLGRLNDQQGRHRAHRRGIVVAGHVYFMFEDQPTRPNYEVQDILWVRLDRFLDRRYFTTLKHPTAPDEIFPGVRVSAAAHQIVWGLTRRFMMSFLTTVGTDGETDPGIGERP